MSPDTNGNAPASTPRWFDRLADGAAALVRDIATDAHAAYAGVFFHGSAINQPYLTGRAAGDQEHALSEIAGGLGDGVKTLLGADQGIDARLQQMSKELTGQNRHGPEQEHDRDQGRGL